MKRTDFIGKINLTINTISTGMSGSSLRSLDSIDKVDVDWDRSEGKNEIIVKVNGEVVFKYDSNLKGLYMMNNNIQVPVGLSTVGIEEANDMASKESLKGNING